MIALVLVGLAVSLLRIGYGTIRSSMEEPAVTDGGEGGHDER